ncbi:MAG TPA: heavy-metal-associated domain-containing protein [Synergistales bacterium]|jgi:copper chaperone|nr:heavy-metal-associated domain-containing protein [Synergistales bacterium]HRV70424.1 heavy-metal-associated domain-containing protein [Thermovirgaceae bacterium]
MGERLVYGVPAMSCGHCVRRISEVLVSLGVEGFDVSLENKVIYTDDPLDEKVIKALSDAGYEVFVR